jgi:hypothetical protein
MILDGDSRDILRASKDGAAELADARRRAASRFMAARIVRAR